MKKPVTNKRSTKKMDPDFGRMIIAGKGFGEVDKNEYVKLEKLAQKNSK